MNAKPPARPILGVLFFLAIATAARGQSGAGIESRWFLRPTLGVQSGSSFGRLLPLPGTADVPDIEILLERGKPAWRLALGYRVSSRFELQSAFQFEKAEIFNDVGIGLTGQPLGKSRVSGADMLSWTGRLVFRWPLRPVTPFLSLGAGILRLETGEFGGASSLALLMGAGLELPLHDRLRAVFEVGDVLHFFDFVEDFDIAYIQIYRPEMKTSSHSAGVHLGLKFGF